MNREERLVAEYRRHYVFIILSLLITIVFFLPSCTTKSALRVDKLASSTLNNDFNAAISTIKKKPQMYGNNSRFLYYMDIGVLYHFAEEYDSSTVYLLKASDIFNELFARSITNEAAAIMVNDNVRPYRSKPYELVMLHQILALNFLTVGKLEDALVETRKVQLFFDEWKRKNRSESKYDSDAMFHYLSSIAYDAANETSDAMISLFHAVKTFQDGPVPLPASIGDQAYYLFELNDRNDDNSLLGLSPKVPRNQITGIENNSSEIIVIGYAGRGPVFEEESWWGTWVKDGVLVVHHNAPDGSKQTITMPAPGLPPAELRKAEKGHSTKSGTTFHIKFALPAIRTVPSSTKGFSVTCSGFSRPFESVVINDLDKQAEKYMEDARSRILARTVVRVVLRTIAAQKAKEQLQTGNTATNLLLNIGTDILAGQLEKADTRSCFLLPKTVQMARIPVPPGKYSISVNAKSASGVLTTKTFNDLSIAAHEKKFLFISSFK